MSFLRGSVLVKGQFVVQMDIATYSHTALKFPALPWSPGRSFSTLSSGLLVFVLWKENYKVKAKLALCFNVGKVALNRA